MDAKDYLGKVVVLKKPNGDTYAVARVTGYIDGPVLSTTNGLFWRADSCELYRETVSAEITGKDSYKISIAGMTLSPDAVLKIVKDSLKE